MIALTARSGHVLRVADEAAADYWVSLGYQRAQDGASVEDGASEESYSSLKVGDLRAEIDRRNEGRDEARLIPSDGKKADLVAALQLDDANN